MDGLCHHQGNKDSERCQDQQHNAQYGDDRRQGLIATKFPGDQVMNRGHHCRKEPSHEDRHQELVDHGKKESGNDYDQAEESRFVDNVLFHFSECG